MTADTITAIKKALEGAEHFIVNGVAFGYISMPDPETPDAAHQTLPMIRQALSSLNVEPELTCPHIDKLVQSGELSIEAIQELKRIRDINSMLRYGLWHEKVRVEEAETKAVGLEAELALSKPVYSRRKLEARLEEAESEVNRYREALHIISAGHACPIALANNALRPTAVSSTGDTHGN